MNTLELIADLDITGSDVDKNATCPHNIGDMFVAQEFLFNNTSVKESARMDVGTAKYMNWLNDYLRNEKNQSYQAGSFM